ncbi:MAG TPA: dihydrofolate reductase [Steroidobacteraceae bacterium]|nr:dihydrofolate reductase [Steroidobacteraceae bacterium]
MAPLISLLVAASDNDVIGRDNALPWHLPDDLRRFKSLTLGKPMLMGRRTFESIGRALPGRTSLVLTRSSEWQRPGAQVVRSLDEALAAAGAAPELVVIGGAEVFALAWRYASRLYLTRVHACLSGDTHFPPLDAREWRETEREWHPADARHAHAITFSVLERVPALERVRARPTDAAR